MNSRDNIQDELKGLNSNLPLEANKTPYSVPQGYFEGLASSLLSKIKGDGEFSSSQEIAQLSPLLAAIDRKMPNTIPENFFERGIEELPVLIRDENSLVLSFVSKEMPFDLPLEYFANLPEQVLSKVSDRGAKVIPIVRRKWMRMAVAAVITGIISLSGYLYFTSKTSSGNLNAPIAQQLKNVSTKEIDEFIKTADPVVATTEIVSTSGTKEKVKTEVKQLLTDVSDKELDAFLNQVPTDDEDLYALN